jgi:glycine cleavage system H protein
MPVSGKVVEFNNLLDSAPELVNQEPYNNGWIIKVEVNENQSVTNLLSPNEYREIIGL